MGYPLKSYPEKPQTPCTWQLFRYLKSSIVCCLSVHLAECPWYLLYLFPLVSSHVAIYYHLWMHCRLLYLLMCDALTQTRLARYGLIIGNTVGRRLHALDTRLLVG